MAGGQPCVIPGPPVRKMPPCPHKVRFVELRNFDSFQEFCICLRVTQTVGGSRGPLFEYTIGVTKDDAGLQKQDAGLASGISFRTGALASGLVKGISTDRVSGSVPRPTDALWPWSPFEYTQQVLQKMTPVCKKRMPGSPPGEVSEQGPQPPARSKVFQRTW